LKKPWQVYVAPPDPSSTPVPLDEGSIDVIPGEPEGLSPGQDSNAFPDVSSPLFPAGIDRLVPGNITDRADWASTNIVEPGTSPEPVPLEPSPDEPVPDEPAPDEPVPPASSAVEPIGGYPPLSSPVTSER